MNVNDLTHPEKIDYFLRTVAEARLSALLLDYDGTLAPFSVNRDQAMPYAGVRELLQRIMDSGRTRMVVITGREARQIGPLLEMQKVIEVWGLHGLQRLRVDGSCEMPNIPAVAAQGLEEAARWLAFHGLQHLAEIKPGSLALHWRVLDDDDARELRQRVLLAWFQIADRKGLRLLEFDGGVEMRIAGPDKGDAVHTVLGELGADIPVAYLGDDTTDERAFHALEHRGLTALVRPTPRKTSAQVWLKAPDDLLDFLSRWDKATDQTLIQRAYIGQGT